METHVQEVEDGSHGVAGVDITSRESVAGDVTRRGRHGVRFLRRVSAFLAARWENLTQLAET
jgi:hypothetical protein